jgi:integrase
MAVTLAPKTVLTNAGVLRAMLNAAVLDDRLYASPYRQPKLPSPVGIKKRRLTMPEQRRLADSLPPVYAPMVFIAGVLGLRLSEVIGLRVGDIDFLGRPPTLRVNCPLTEVSGRHVESKGKTTGSRVPLTVPSFLVDMLAEHLAATERRTPERFVFEAPRGGPLHAANFRGRIWSKAIQKSGFEGLTFHGLRHSASGLMRQVGAHDQLIQQRMRHTHRPTTTDIYGWVPDQADVDVNAALDALYSAADVSQESVGSSANPRDVLRRV